MAVYDKDILSELMNKPMTRKEFLHNLGLLILSMFGASALLGLMLKQTPQGPREPSNFKQAGKGYGGTGYGL
jgi:hypothetical protein